MTAPVLKLRTTKFVNKHSTNWPNYQIDWAVFWVLICTVHLTVCFCYVTYASQSESTHYSCLNVKEVLAQSTREIWSLNDCNWTWTQNHLVRKRTRNHWAVFWLLIFTMHLILCSCYVTYAFQSESTVYSSLNVKKLLARSRCKIWSLIDCKNWPNDWAVLWVLISMVHLTVWSCHVTYQFQSESTLYTCVNVKELLALSGCKIWSLRNCN